MLTCNASGPGPAQPVGRDATGALRMQKIPGLAQPQSAPGAIDPLHKAILSASFPPGDCLTSTVPKASSPWTLTRAQRPQGAAGKGLGAGPGGRPGWAA